jgi:hypothetical protein
MPLNQYLAMAEVTIKIPEPIIEPATKLVASVLMSVSTPFYFLAYSIYIN